MRFKVFPLFLMFTFLGCNNNPKKEIDKNHNQIEIITYDNSKVIKYYNSNRELIYYESFLRDSIQFRFSIPSSQIKFEHRMAGLLFEDNCESCHVLKGNLVGPEITKKANYKLFLKAHPSFKNKIDSTNYGILKKYCVNRGLLH